MGAGSTRSTAVSSSSTSPPALPPSKPWPASSPGPMPPVSPTPSWRCASRRTGSRCCAACSRATWTCERPGRSGSRGSRRGRREPGLRRGRPPTAARHHLRAGQGGPCRIPPQEGHQPAPRRRGLEPGRGPAPPRAAGEAAVEVRPRLVRGGQGGHRPRQRGSSPSARSRTWPGRRRSTSRPTTTRPSVPRRPAARWW